MRIFGKEQTINTQIKKRKWAWIGHPLRKPPNHQTASPDRPSNGTHKAKEAEDDLETPGVDTQSQN